jgi:signal transduction histidine kinase
LPSNGETDLNSRVEQLEAELESVAGVRQRIDTLNALAWELRHSDVQRAMALSEEAQALACEGELETSPYQNGLAESLRNLGRLHLQMSEYGLALSLSLEALALFEEMDAPVGRATVLNTIGSVHFHLGNYPHALESQLDALRISEQVGEKRTQAAATNLIGLVYWQSGDHETALEHFYASAEIYREIGDRTGEADAIHNCGVMCRRLGDYENALSCGFESLHVYQEVDARQGQAEVLTSIGEVFMCLDDHTQALDYLGRSVDVSREIGNRYQETCALINLGEVHRRQEETDAALSLLHQALAIAESTDSNQQAFEIHLALAEVYKQVGDFENALLHYERFHTIRESVFDQQADIRLKSLQAIYEVERAKEEAEVYQLRNVALRQEIHDRQRAEQVAQTLLDTAQALGTTLRLDKVLEKALDEIQRILPYDAASISMLRDERGWIVASRGLERISWRRFDLRKMPLIRRVVDRRGPVVVPDVRTEPDWVRLEGLDSIRSWLGAPLIARDEVIGILMMDAYQAGTYDEEAGRWASAFAHQVAFAMENSRLYEQVRVKLREANLLHSVTMALASTLDMSQMLPYVARSLCEILNGSSVEIYGLDEGGDTFGVVARYVVSSPAPSSNGPSNGPSDGEEGRGGSALGSPLDLACTLADWPAVEKALERRQPVQVQADDPEADPRLREMLEACGTQAMLLLPMVVGDNVLGFSLVWDSQAERRFTEGEIATGQMLIHQATITMDNARLVEALRRRTAELQARNEELDAFSHTVAHDLKGPLGHIMGYAYLLRDLSLVSEEDYHTYVQAIEQGGQKVRNIIDELLLLASVRKLEEIETKPLDMAPIVAEASRRLSFVIEQYQADLVLPAEDSWPLAVGHGPWIEEVWANYLSNALKYGGTPPRVELGADPLPPPPSLGGIEGGEDGGRRMIRFWVRDNGPGLTPQEQAHLFTPFARLEQVRAKGHGLGLSIVRRIVEKLGGQVGIESEVGQGSTFSFTLPAADQA